MKNRTTGIEWCEHTWNPFVGCTIISPGCRRCYAMQMAARIVEMKTTETYNGTVAITNGHPIWTGRINHATPITMRKPFTIRRPSIVFVNSMSDFFHEGAPDAWRIEALGIMATTPHQFLILTKRPEQIQPFLDMHDVAFPSNIWIGATVERADFAHRVDTLRKVPAAIRFLSVEPIVGPLADFDLTGIHWVIGGGESGPGARPMDAEDARLLRNSCIRQGVPFFWKQWGTTRNNPLFAQAMDEGHPSPGRFVSEMDPHGKGGSKIDGREWKEYPPYLKLPALA